MLKDSYVYRKTLRDLFSVYVSIKIFFMLLCMNAIHFCFECVNCQLEIREMRERENVWSGKSGKIQGIFQVLSDRFWPTFMYINVHECIYMLFFRVNIIF